MRIRMIKKLKRAGGNDWNLGTVVEVSLEYGRELIKSKHAKEIVKIHKIEIRKENLIPNDKNK